MTAFESAGIFPYLAIFLAAVVEGEIVFVGACVLVRMGHLDPMGVFLAGALGGSAGDQAYFYLFRGRLRNWLSRFGFWRRNRHRLDHLVERHATKMILACRFLPGMRILIQAACAHAGVSPAKFSALSLISSFVWAGMILSLVSYFGPEILERFGITAWWAPVIVALAVISVFQWLRVRSKNRIASEGCNEG